MYQIFSLTMWAAVMRVSYTTLRKHKRGWWIFGIIICLLTCLTLIGNPSFSQGSYQNQALAPLSFGVNLWGFVRGEFGVGEAARLTATALLASSTPIALNDLHYILSNVENHRHTDKSLENYGISNRPYAPYFFNIIHLNADMQHILYNKIGPSYYHKRYNIGVLFWELDHVPQSMHGAFWYLDEIWAVSDFIADAFRKVAPIPVLKIRDPVASLHPKKQYTRRDFGLEETDFVYFFNFDYESLPIRKNPIAVLKAFALAFPEQNSAILIVKSINSATDPLTVSELRKVATNSRILWMDKHISADEIAGLFSIIDVYISLHRSEGLGLGMLQALQLGKILIATNYSGNAEFTTSETAYIVPYQLVQLKEDYGPYKQGNTWAEANITVAAHWIKFVYLNQEQAWRKAKNARLWVNQHYSSTATGLVMQERLLEIWDDRTELLRYLEKKQRNFGLPR